MGNDKRTGSRLSGLVLLGLLGALFTPVSSQGQEEVRISGQDVAIYNLAGQVELVSGAGSDVLVQVRRGGNDAERLDMDVIRVDGREALVIRYPDDRVIYPEIGRGSRTQIRIHEDGTFGGGGEGDRVEIRGSGSGMEAWADLRISIPNGKDVAVFLAVGEMTAEGVQADLLMDTGSGAITARRITGKLGVDSGSGEVFVDGVEGDLMVDTGSGEVEVHSVRGDQVILDTGSGEVTVRGVTASDFEVDTGSGEVVLEEISAPNIRVDTGSGEVEIDLLQDVDDLVVDTGSGSVTVRFPAGLGAEVEVDTGSGGIDLDVSLEVRELKRDYLRGTIGDGRGSIRIDTGSGNVRLLNR